MLRTRRTDFDDTSASDAIALLDRVLPGARAGAGDDPDASLIIATRSHPQGDRVVGCVGVVASGDGVGRLIGPVVDPQLRQQGIGRRLLAEGEREALGNRRFRRLHCPAHRQHAAFLEGLGWKPASEAGETVDFVLEVEGDDPASANPPGAGGLEAGAPE